MVLSLLTMKVLSTFLILMMVLPRHVMMERWLLVMRRLLLRLPLLNPVHFVLHLLFLPRRLLSPASFSTSPSFNSMSPALVSSVSTPPSSASVPALPDVPLSVPAVPASSAVSSAITFDSESVTSVASSSVPVSRSSVVARRDKIDSYLGTLGDFSRDDVVRMSPARVTDFVSLVIEKNGLSVDSHQCVARFVYHVQRKFCVQLHTGKKPTKRAPAKISECEGLPAGRQTRPSPLPFK